MGGPGLLAVVGTAKELPKVELPDCKILVDVGSFYAFLVRAVYNSKKSIAPEVFAAKCILNWFDVPDVEFFIDGHGNEEKHATSMSRRNNDATLDEAEAIVERMEEKAERGECIKKVDYKTCS
ncbi:hypothetical protein BGZ83_011044, partial [Gryganskiella cystojenkinii]